jgi:hypothetical protein
MVIELISIVGKEELKKGVPSKRGIRSHAKQAGIGDNG